MEETGKKSTEESESLYVGSSALSSGTSYLIVTSLSSSIIVYINDNNYKYFSWYEVWNHITLKLKRIDQNNKR